MQELTAVAANESHQSNYLIEVHCVFLHVCEPPLIGIHHKSLSSQSPFGNFFFIFSLPGSRCQGPNHDICTMFSYLCMLICIYDVLDGIWIQRLGGAGCGLLKLILFQTLTRRMAPWKALQGVDDQGGSTIPRRSRRLPSAR